MEIRATSRPVCDSMPCGDAFPPNQMASPIPAGRLAEAAAAYERYDALMSSCEQWARREDDHCESGHLAHAALYVREQGDLHDVEPGDIRQGMLPNCYVMATLCAIAGSPDGRALVQQAITENKNAQGETVSYTVTLHRPEQDEEGRTTFTEVHINVDTTYVCPHAASRSDGTRQEVWPLVIEKAYAAYCGGYSAKGGVAADVMQALTGREATCTPIAPFFDFGGYGAADLQRDLAAGKMVVLGTRSNVAGSGLVEKHSYWVSGTTMKDGRLCVLLHNPWNEREPPPVPIDRLASLFNTVDVGSVR